ncbi:MAG TPA: DoxX family protein [Sphingomicrobium sp.]
MRTAAILIARLILGLVFLQAAAFKFLLMGMDATAGEIAAAGFPLPLLLAWVAAFFELALAIGFLTGLFFTEVAIVAIAYVLFLAFSFHGPDRWAGNVMEYGFFTDHFVFVAGLLFAAVHGPGTRFVLAPNFASRRKSWPTS